MAGKTAAERHLAKILLYLGDHRRISSQEVSELLGLSARYAGGLLRDFVRDNHLVEVEKPHARQVWYFANKPDFYTPEELQELLPAKEIARLRHPLEYRAISGEEKGKLLPFKIGELASIFYGSTERGHHFIKTFFKFYEEKGLVKGKHKGKTIELTTLGLEHGIDAQSIRTLNAREIEGQLVLTRKQALIDRFQSMDDVREAIAQDLENKLVSEKVIKVGNGDSFSISFWNELLFGNQFTDMEFFLWSISHLPKDDIKVATGLVQGNFLGIQADKARTLSFGSGLNEVDVQFHAANLALQEMQRCTDRVFYVQGDDDEALALSYARMAHVAEGGVVSYGFNTKTLAAEKKRRLDLLALYRKWQIQWEIICSYHVRIGRTLLNSDEVYDRIGVYKSEYRLIIEILVAQKSDFDYPEEYKKVVCVDALFGDISQARIVTPDSLILSVNGKKLHFVHNAQFSNITQYVDSIRTPEDLMRHFAARGIRDVPWMFLTGHDERLFITHIPGNNDVPDGNWVVNLPGLQNPIAAAQGLVKNFHSRILSSKHHRQNTVRKEPVSPGVVQFENRDDGRLRWRIVNENVARVIEQNKDEPEKIERLLLLQDTQFGSITMCPELVALFLDYALYTKKAEHFWYNGDVIQGVNYPQFFSENRFIRLTSVDAQQRFANALVTPFIVNAPTLKDFTGVIGNHEWNTFCTGLVGSNHFNFMEFYLNGVLDGLRQAGIQTPFERASTVSRIDFARIRNISGKKAWVNWPYFSDVFAGYHVAMSHMFKAGGNNPASQQINWMKRMANAIDGLDMLLGGHFHSFWLAMVFGKIAFQAPGAASISGYEFHRGYTSEVMFQLFTFSNKAGIEIECVPARFLADHYEPISPILNGKKDQLAFPEENTPEYRHGKFSPFVEDMIDNITWHISV